MVRADTLIDSVPASFFLLSSRSRTAGLGFQLAVGSNVVHALLMMVYCQPMAQHPPNIQKGIRVSAGKATEVLCNRPGRVIDVKPEHRPLPCPAVPRCARQMHCNWRFQPCLLPEKHVFLRILDPGLLGKRLTLLRSRKKFGFVSRCKLLEALPGTRSLVLVMVPVELCKH